MKTLKHILISLAVVGLPISAMADDDGRRGHGNHHKHHHKHHDDRHHHKHHDKHYHKHHHKHGRDYRHHDHHVQHHHYRHYAPHVRHEPVYVPAPPPVVYQPQGVSVHGNVHIPF